MKSLFVFHRDFSLDDNLALIRCIEESNEVYLCFILNPEQVNERRNEYYNSNSISFMIESLEEIPGLDLAYGEFRDVVEKYMDIGVKSVWESLDVTPFAVKRQEKHAKVCKSLGLDYYLEETVSLHRMGTILTNSGDSYKKFTPFKKKALEYSVPEPIKLKKKHLKKLKKAAVNDSRAIKLAEKLKNNKHLAQKPGRRHALKILRQLCKLDYSKRDFPSYSTSLLSSHLHFGNVSPREVYAAATQMPSKHRDVFIEQLLWREFYLYQIYYHHTTYSKKSFTIDKMNRIKWKKDSKSLYRWKTGTTGVPIVDAGMRELLETGYMHNRLRMIVAMFLIHFLGIHWCEGEKWFAQNLVDYDYCNNYGGWVWCAGTEVHSNPYFRIFSIESQAKRFDKEGEYTKKWCPELTKVEARHLYDWEKHYDKYNVDYPSPMISCMQEIRKNRIEYLKNL
jgi:deoxyribodipyrimidine photo-lyase